MPKLTPSLTAEIVKHLPTLPLSKRSRKMMEYRHGVTNGKTHTLEETGKKFKVTKERIRQVEQWVVEVIKHDKAL